MPPMTAGTEYRRDPRTRSARAFHSPISAGSACLFAPGARRLRIVEWL